MKPVSKEKFFDEVKKTLKQYYFQNITDDEMNEMCNSEDGTYFLNGGYEDYLDYCKNEPESDNNLSSAVSATAYNIHMFF